MPYDQTQGTIDFGFLWPNFNGDVQVFTPNNSNSLNSGMQKWVKPRGVTQCYMLCIGGGGGGGGGRSGATTTARGGGAGGACSGIAKLWMPAIYLPDTLWVAVGQGGAGGAANTNGSGSLTSSYIFYSTGISGISIAPNLILLANASSLPGGGNAGGVSGNATGGTASSIVTTTTIGPAASFGLFQAVVSLAGATGGSPTAAGTAVTAVWNTINLSPGAGGGGVTSVGTGFAGGAITIQAAMDFADGAISPASSFLAGGIAGPSGTSAGGVGNSGVQLWKPLYSTGGSGGGSSDNAVGGNGGNGGIGCGGGGGGAGTTGGTGGNGGDGIVIIISW